MGNEECVRMRKGESVMFAVVRYGHPFVAMAKQVLENSKTKWQLIAGDMNDALCDITWSGPQKKNYQMGYICEVEYDAKHRSRRAAEQSSCQVEYRTRKGLLLNVQMSCKARG